MNKINFKAIQGRLGQAAGLAAGSVAGNYAKNAMEKMGGGKIKPVVNAGIRVLAGAILPAVTKSKTGFMVDLANGMMAGAAVDLAKELKVPGVGGTDVDEPIGDYMTGTDVDEPINGTDN
ncbi:MAG: hypothetical protein ABIN74_01640 [Ferruginibacter sp.]